MDYKINTYQKKDSNFAQLSSTSPSSFLPESHYEGLESPVSLKISHFSWYSLQTLALQVCITNPTLGILSKIDERIWVC